MKTAIDDHTLLYADIYSAIAHGLSDVEVSRDITGDIMLATENVLNRIYQARFQQEWEIPDSTNQ